MDQVGARRKREKEGSDPKYSEKEIYDHWKKTQIHNENLRRCSIKPCSYFFIIFSPLNQMNILPADIGY
jgi:hypothetical protein